MRKEYQEELADITNKVIKMGGNIEQQINLTIKAIETTDAKIAEKIMTNDDIVDNLELEVEKDCINIIARQTPLAKDLRRVSAILKMSTDIERIADHCSDISEYIIKLDKAGKIPVPEYIIDMCYAMKKMVLDTITAFVNQDVVKAIRVMASDNIVDDYFADIVKLVVAKIKSDPKNVEQYVYYLMIVKYIERMSDHSANIANWIKYMVTGDITVKEC